MELFWNIIAQYNNRNGIRRIIQNTFKAVTMLLNKTLAITDIAIAIRMVLDTKMGYTTIIFLQKLIIQSNIGVRKKKRIS